MLTDMWLGPSGGAQPARRTPPYGPGVVVAPVRASSLFQFPKVGNDCGLTISLPRLGLPCDGVGNDSSPDGFPKAVGALSASASLTTSSDWVKSAAANLDSQPSMPQAPLHACNEVPKRVRRPDGGARRGAAGGGGSDIHDAPDVEIVAALVPELAVGIDEDLVYDNELMLVVQVLGVEGVGDVEEVGVIDKPGSTHDELSGSWRSPACFVFKACLSASCSQSRPSASSSAGGADPVPGH